MAQVRIILRHYWSAYRRRLQRSASATAGSQVILLLISFILFFRYLQFLQKAADELKTGETAILESLLAVIFIVWLFPLFGSSSLGLDVQKLRHFPLSPRKLFVVWAISHFFQPHVWLLTIGSLLIFYPLIHAPNIVVGMLAAFLFVAASCLNGLGLTRLLIFSGRRIEIILLTLLGAIGFYTLKGGSEKLISLSSYLPHKLVASAAFGKQVWLALGFLAALTALAFSAASFLFDKSLARATTGTRLQKIQIFDLFRVFGIVGALAAKDLRYFRHLLDTYLGLAVGSLGGIYLAFAGAPGLAALQFFIAVVFICNAAIAFNSFGFDGQNGLNRYALSPLDGRTILLGKNLAFTFVAFFHVCFLMLPAIWRLGWSSAAYGLAEAVALAFAYSAYGNWASVSRPSKLEFYRFYSSGSPFDDLWGVTVGSLPALAVVFISHKSPSPAVWLIAPVLIVCAALYVASIVAGGKRFERKRETLVQFL